MKWFIHKRIVQITFWFAKRIDPKDIIAQDDDRIMYYNTKGEMVFVDRKIYRMTNFG